jgi:hypothetical protein
MTYKGTVKGKTIELDDPIPVEEGTRVDVMVVPEGRPRRGSPQAWLQLVGTLTNDEADAIEKFVTEEIRPVDSDMWETERQ